MNRLTMTLALVLSLFLGGCSHAPKLDASTPQTLKDSSQRIRETLSPEQAKRFDAAITMVIAATLDPMQTLDLAISGSLPTQQSVFEQLKPVFNGLTYDEVVDLGEKSSSKVRTNLATWRTKQSQLQGAYDRHMSGTKIAAKFSPVAADLRNVQSPMQLLGSDNTVVVDVTFKNELDRPVDAVSLMVGLAPAGVDNPWVREPVSFRFPAPIPPGGQGHVVTRPIYVSVPATYNGPVKLEALFDVTRLDLKGAAPVIVPEFSQDQLVLISKLETSIDQVEALMKTLQPVRG